MNKKTVTIAVLSGLMMLGAETTRRKYGAGEREKMKQVTFKKLNEGKPAPVLPVRWRLGDSPRERRVGDGL